MEDYTPDFSVAVQGVKGFCPAGEVYATRNISTQRAIEECGTQALLMVAGRFWPTS